MAKRGKRSLLFAGEIVEYFSKRGYLVEERGPLDLIIRTGSSWIPVEVKCRTKRIKNRNAFTIWGARKLLTLVMEMNCDPA